MLTTASADVADELARVERTTLLLNDDVSRRLLQQYIRDIEYGLTFRPRLGGVPDHRRE